MLDGVADDGWRPLRAPASAHRPGAASPFSRLAVTHAFSVAGDTLLTIALADSLFFSIGPDAAKGRVALYLALTMAPFAVIAPLIGPALDRTRGGRRMMVVGTAAARAVLCLLMASDVHSLLLFPEAFAFLVSSKTYAVTKSALVPAAVAGEDELVEANAKLSLIGVVVGFVAAVPALVLRLAGVAWVLRLAALVFVAALAAAARIRRAEDVGPAEAPAERVEVRQAGILLAASAMALLRGIVGFLTFLVAFNFRRPSPAVPKYWYGIVLAASMAGTLLGAAAAPRLRQAVREERILLGGLATVAAVGLVAARAGDRLWAAVLAGAVGMAASAGKLAFDSIVQRDAPDIHRGRWFARFETRFQLTWVAGAFVPVVLPVPLWAGFLVVAGIAAFAGFSYWAGAAGRPVGRRRPS